MRKLFLLFFIVVGFSALNITRALAGCNIMWTGSLSGTVPTQGTSKTQQAVQELYNTLVYMGDCFDYAGFGEFGYPTAFFNNNCYGFDTYGNRSHFQKWVCADGTWTINCEYFCGPFAGNCYYNDAGTWDVVCDSITTTTAATTSIPPTAIELSSFSATPAGSSIILEWETESETNNAGFNIRRAEAENGEYVKINDELIPTKGSSTHGASYEFIDTDVQNQKTYYYELEDIDLLGTLRTHGPVHATAGSPASTTTTTAADGQCAAETIYGERSAEVELLREYRDMVLSRSATGRRIISQYYELSPAVAEFLRKNPAARERARRALNSIIPAIRKKLVK